MKKRLTLSITLILTLLAGLLTTGMAFASDGTEDEVAGIIVEIFEDYVVIDVEGELLEIPFGENFDPEVVKIAVGDEIVVNVKENGDGDLVITKLKIQERARDRVQLQEGELAANYCAVEDVNHPVAYKIAETYGVPYDEIEAYLCGENHVPLGQIMLALQTAAISDYSFIDFLDGFENIKWGKIWQELGIKGKPDHGDPPGQIKKQDGENDPDGPSQPPSKNGK